MELSEEELEACARALQRIADDPAAIQGHERLKGLVAKIHREGRRAERRVERERRDREDRQLRAGVAERREAAPEQAPAEGEGLVGELHRPRGCYICKRPYREVHAAYHMLCPACAAENLARRRQRADLAGRAALVTGGRVKIGFQTALRMLRDGARVIVTTRFPRDAARRFAAEPDFGAWSERLAVYDLDLRDVAAVEAFARHLDATEPRLDILVNNAAQTVKRPRGFYEHLLAAERAPAPAGEDLARLTPPHAGWETPLLEALPDYRGHLPAEAGHFLPGELDRDGQQVDRRPDNSWVLRLHEVGTVELLEVQLVNAVAPFLLAARLRPLLLRSPAERRFIVNVSAMEGQFARPDKTIYHPHTNMAKAALNMLTRTAAADYARDGIYMSCVDTGWVTDENPHARRLHARERRGFYPPLDVVDGMARVYDPVVRGLADEAEPPHGLFLKDYRPHPW